MAISNTSIPKPRDWQDFERKTRVLFAHVLNDPNTQMHGRSGQKQHGVDVFGYRDRDPDQLVGVQCKKSEDRITETELRKEFQDSLGFNPPIREFFLVTTAARDTGIQEVARVITKEQADTDRPVFVCVWAWEDIEESVSQFPSAWKAFDPTVNAFSEAAAESYQADLSAVKKGIDALTGLMTAGASASGVGAGTDERATPLHGQISAMQSLVDAGDARVALRQLEQIEAQEFDDASESEKFRLLVCKAGACLRLGRQEDAGNQLLSAAASFPGDAKSSITEAKGNFLVGNHGLAEQQAIAILDQDKTNLDAASLVIHARAPMESRLDPLAGIPDELHESEEVLAARIHFSRSRDDSAWHSLAKQGADKFKSNGALAQFAAEAMLDQAVRTSKDAIVGGPLCEIERSELTEAIELLASSAEKQLEQSEFVQASLAHNAALGLRFVDDLDRAKQILEAAIGTNSTDRDLRFQLALIDYVNGDNERTIELLSGDEDGESIGLLAHTFFELGDPKKAIDLLEGKLDAIEANDSVKASMLDVLARSYVSIGDVNRADQLMVESIAADPTLEAGSAHVRLLRQLGRIDEANELFDDLLSKVDDATSLTLRLVLSGEARKLGRFEDVVGLLRGKVEAERLSEGLRVLVESAIEGDMLATSHELLSEMSAEVHESEWGKRVGVIVAINSGEADAAKKIDDYLSHAPHDAQMLIARVHWWQILDQTEELAPFLEALDLPRIEGRPTDLIRIAALVAHYQSSPRGLQFGYDVLMDNWGKPKVHLAYQSLVLMREERDPELLSAEVVAEGCAVGVQTSGVERRYRIEGREHRFFEEERLAPDDELAQILVGMKEGETLEKTERIGEQESTVSWIKPVYLDALHRSLNEFNERFPRADGLMKMSFDPDAEDPLLDMRAIAKDRAEADERVLDLYDQNIVPLAFVAPLIGKDPVDVFTSLGSVDKEFRVCMGAHQERESALAQIELNAEGGCVLDAVTLALVQRLDLASAVEAVCGPIHTTQSVLELFVRRAKESAFNAGRKAGFVSWRNGELQFEEYSEEVLRQVAEERQAEADWISDSVKLVAAVPSIEPGKDWRELTDRFHRYVTDPALGASGSGLMLLSDDMGFRNLAAERFGLNASWLQPVMMIAVDGGALDMETYCESINNMVFNNHTYISLKWECLFHQAEKDGFLVTPQLQQLLRHVGGVNADLDSNSGVLASFIDQCAGANPEDELIPLRIASECFRWFRAGRSEDEASLISLIVRKVRFVKDIGSHARRWQLGHAIGQPHFLDLLAASRSWS